MHVGKLFILLSISIVTSHSYVQAASASAAPAPASTGVVKSTSSATAFTPAAAPNTNAGAWPVAGVSTAASTVIDTTVLTSFGSHVTAPPHIDVENWTVVRVACEGTQYEQRTVKVLKHSSLDQLKTAIRQKYEWASHHPFDLYRAYEIILTAKNGKKINGRTSHTKEDNYVTKNPLANLNGVDPRIGVYALSVSEVEEINRIRATIRAEKDKKNDAASTVAVVAAGAAPAAAPKKVTTKK